MIMLNLRRKIPPLRSLIAFEACARHLSFTRAAQELGVTQVAISRQIKSLEDYVGCKLFDRLHRAIRLNEAGREFQEEIVPSLTRMASCVDRLQSGGSSHKLTVGTTTGFSAYWLMPRLSRFRAAYPDVDLRIAVDDKCVDLKSGGIDLAIRYGQGNWPGVTSEFFCESRVIPLCSPSYWGDRAITDNPADLLGEQLIDFDYVVDSSWANWFAWQDVKLDREPATIITDAYTSMVQAAQSGQGIALLSAPLIEDLVHCDALMAPTSMAPQKLPGGYYLVRPKNQEVTEASQQLVCGSNRKLKKSEPLFSQGKGKDF